jgi:hypothetical protein
VHDAVGREQIKVSELNAHISAAIQRALEDKPKPFAEVSQWLTDLTGMKYDIDAIQILQFIGFILAVLYCSTFLYIVIWG